MSAFVRIARIFFMVAFCCSAAFADMHPPSEPASGVVMKDSGAPDVQAVSEGKQSDLAASRLASLAPPVLTQDKDAPPATEPFEYAASLGSTAELLAKWGELQPRILADEKALAACRSDDSACSQAARSFLSIIELGRKQEGRARLGWVNRAVNMSVKPASDWAQYGYADYWASPLQTLLSGAGDCEDYAIVKYVALRELDVAANDLRFVIVRDDKHQAEHAVVAVRHEQQWLILDNRTMTILNAEDVRNYRPLLALDRQNSRTLAAASVDQIIGR